MGDSSLCHVDERLASIAVEDVPLHAGDEGSSPSPLPRLLGEDKLNHPQTPTTHTSGSRQSSTPGNLAPVKPDLSIHHREDDDDDDDDDDDSLDGLDGVDVPAAATTATTREFFDDSDTGYKRVEPKPLPKTETSYFLRREDRIAQVVTEIAHTGNMFASRAISHQRASDGIEASYDGEYHEDRLPHALFDDLSSRVCKISGEVLESRIFRGVTYWRTETIGHAGLLLFTNYKLVFYADEKGRFFEETTIPYGFISKISKVGRQQSRYVNGHYGIAVHCCDVRPTIRFTFVPVGHPRRAVMRLLRQKTFASSHLVFFAFQSTERYPSRLKEDFICDDYVRMGFPNDKWRITRANDAYLISPTLPRYLVVPKCISDEHLMRAKAFRAEGRIPVVSWIHPETNAVIVRASQPAVGLMGSRNVDDEVLVQAIIDCNPSTYKMAILDARPEINALINRAMGNGFEIGDVYSNCALEFMSIANMHAVRSSYQSLKEICLYTSTDGTSAKEWWSSVRGSSWFSHLSTIMRAVRQIVSKVSTEKMSVLVHCSDGWDRTPQLVSLAMLLMDKYYRTIDGFYMLIEKEWLQLGHRFGTRCGNSIFNEEEEKSPLLNKRELAPVFVQFLDCTFQLLSSYPRAFQFTERLLRALANHVYSRRFGNFLMDTQKGRDELGTRSTPCFWTYADAKRDMYLNDSYLEMEEPIVPKCSASQMKLWAGHFMKRRKFPTGTASKKDEVLEGNLATFFFGT